MVTSSANSTTGAPTPSSWFCSSVLQLGLAIGPVAEGLGQVRTDQAQRPGGQGRQHPGVLGHDRVGGGTHPGGGQVGIDDGQERLLRRQPQEAAGLLVVVGLRVGQGQEVSGGPGDQRGLGRLAAAEAGGHADLGRVGRQARHLQIHGQAEMPQQLGMVTEQAHRGVEVELRLAGWARPRLRRRSSAPGTRPPRPGCCPGSRARGPARRPWPARPARRRPGGRPGAPGPCPGKAPGSAPRSRRTPSAAAAYRRSRRTGAARPAYAGRRRPATRRTRPGCPPGVGDDGPVHP